jgi:hypothetical protein
MHTAWGRIGGVIEGYASGRVVEMSDGSRWRRVAGIIRVSPRPAEYRARPVADLPKNRSGGRPGRIRLSSWHGSRPTAARTPRALTGSTLTPGTRRRVGS